MQGRHIAIGGSSYTGSTLFGLLLGGIDGIENIGESNWLVPKFGEAIDDASLWTGYKDFQHCRLCGQGCEYLTREFREELQCDPTGWYDRLRDRLGGDVLVSSEKSPANIWKLDPALNNTTLVLFKSPFQHWASVDKRRWKTQSLNTAMNTWANIYRTYLDDEQYAPMGGKIFLNIEKFLADPAEGLRILTGALKVPFDPSTLRYWETKQHYIGGNFNAYERAQLHPEKLEVKAMVQPMRREDNEEIRAHPAHQVYVRLLDKSII